MIHVDKIGNLGTNIKMKGTLPEILSQLETAIRTLRKSISKDFGEKASKELLEELFRASMLSQEERNSELELDDIEDNPSSDKDPVSDFDKYFRKMFEE